MKKSLIETLLDTRRSLVTEDDLPEDVDMTSLEKEQYYMGLIDNNKRKGVIDAILDNLIDDDYKEGN